ncbi:MAG: DUF1349 domain-containing protein [Anaerolineae bacterium]
MNQLADIRPGNLGPFTWVHEPARWEPLPEGGLRVYTPGGVDYFRDPSGSSVSDSAPRLGLPVRGDFVARLHVRPTFTTKWDAGSLLVRQDATHWAKLCFERTDLPSHAIVSVVTNGISDDANGVDLEVADVWLQMARVGNTFGMHYALDGAHWRMVRYFGLPSPAEVEVALEAQCPVGQGGVIDWLAFEMETRTVSDLRFGV